MTYIKHLNFVIKQVILTLFLLFCGLCFGSRTLANNQSNQVLIRAEVKESLSFAVKNISNTEYITHCESEKLLKNNDSLCSYRIKTATNITSGYSILVSKSNELSDGSKSFSNIKNEVLVTHQKIENQNNTQKTEPKYIIYTIIPNY